MRPVRDHPIELEDPPGLPGPPNVRPWITSAFVSRVESATSTPSYGETRTYLASGTPVLPDDEWLKAKALEWMSFEQYCHEPNIAVVRYWHFAGLLDGKDELLPDKMAGGYRALDVMEAHLVEHTFPVGDKHSVGDTFVARQGCGS